MVCGKTRTGFEFVIEDDALNDYEILELMAKVRKNDVLSISELLEKLLGEDQKNRLKDHCRNEAGKVPMERINDEIVDIFAADKVKKS